MAHPIKLPIVFRFLKAPIAWTLETPRPSAFPEYQVLVGEAKKDWSWQHIDNGWECRKEFLKLPEDDNQALCAFMNKIGLFGPDNARPGEAVRTYHTADLSRTVTLPRQIQMLPNRIWGLRRALVEDLDMKKKEFIQLYASDSGPKSGFIPELPFRFKLDADVPTGVLTTVALWEMLLVTIYVDLVRGFSFQTCERPDCLMKFAVETGHPRKFCSQYCGHLESIRKNRRLKKNNRRSSVRQPK